MQQIGLPLTSQAFQADDHAIATVLMLGSPQGQETHILCNAQQQQQKKTDDRQHE
jgi:hypothetical protein